MMIFCSQRSSYFLPVVSAGHTSRCRYIASPMLRGYDVNQMIQFGIRRDDGERICAALDEMKDVLQKHGLLHRDIRPQNIFYTEDKQVYLVDLQFMVRPLPDGTFREFVLLQNREDMRTHLGSEFAKGPGIWDDAYSIEMCKQVIREHYID